MKFGTRSAQRLPQTHSFAGTSRHRKSRIDSRRQGYPRLAAFLDSDSDFAVFRSYGELYTRLLLYKQDELRVLQQELYAIDDGEAAAFFLCSREADQNHERILLFGKIEAKLNEYSALLERYSRTLEYPKPHRKQVDGIFNWLEGNKPLVRTESTFLDDRDDLVAATAPADRGRLDAFIESILVAIINFGPMKDSTYCSNDQHVFLIPHSFVTTLSRAVSALIAVAILIVPIIVLFYVTSMVSRIWVIAVSTLVFSVGLSWLTRSRQYEIFSATAAFCAVMVVFVGSVPGNMTNASR